MNEEFWKIIDSLTLSSEIVIDRPKGTAHPRYGNCVYPFDYGYLKHSSSMDGGGIDVWVGSLQDRKVDAIICTVDILKRDSEIKLLVGCTEQEKETVLAFHNNSDFMKGILIHR